MREPGRPPSNEPLLSQVPAGSAPPLVGEQPNQPQFAAWQEPGQGLSLSFLRGKAGGCQTSYGLRQMSSSSPSAPAQLMRGAAAMLLIPQRGKGKAAPAY